MNGQLRQEASPCRRAASPNAAGRPCVCCCLIAVALESVSRVVAATPNAASWKEVAQALEPWHADRCTRRGNSCFDRQELYRRCQQYCEAPCTLRYQRRVHGGSS
eukprot:TRINITY_DN5539_c0_g1_i2.p4 TRINITY_DN5539_c0_g1~~TRINITY_DN5539_c0_g1_i2.p4  ORF type:complete len:105 (+),score=5.86 TRINITY_DN5539_c0_g1_i2:403-717(+)